MGLEAQSGRTDTYMASTMGSDPMSRLFATSHVVKVRIMAYLARSFALIAALLNLAASAQAQQSRPNQPPADLTPSKCNSGVCVIQVLVTDCNAPGGIRVDMPLVEVSRAVNMRWEIKPPGFVFAADGIRIDPPNAQFRVQHSPRPNEFRLHNAKTSQGDFYYFVNIQGCLPHDPWVRNR
jgi:hypothetical protein